MPFENSKVIPVDKATLAAYLEADYFVVDTAENQTLAIRVGQQSEGLVKILKRHNARTGLIFTAWNPHSQALPMIRNEARNRALRIDPRVANTATRVYPSYGGDDDQTWREDGYFFTGIDCAVAAQLCVDFQQNAGVMVDVNHPAALVWHPRVCLPSQSAALYRCGFA